jgi:hypothetical protein
LEQNRTLGNEEKVEKKVEAKQVLIFPKTLIENLVVVQLAKKLAAFM